MKILKSKATTPSPSLTTGGELKTEPKSKKQSLKIKPIPAGTAGGSKLPLL